MSGETDPAQAAAKVSGGAPRQRSTVAFPYMDLLASAELAEAIFRNVAGGDCDDDQLAAWSNQSSKSSTFRVQVYAARTFGLLTGEASRHKLTDLGMAIVDPQQTREAKVRAFQNVPLYAALFEKFKGGVLPPTAALEREIIAIGVAPKQKERARQVFERSADQAGFYAHGRDRLVQPGISSSGHAPSSPANMEKPGGGQGGGDGGGSLDPLIAALIQKLPKHADPSKPWPANDRVTWLQMTAMAFQMAYGAVDPIDVKVSPSA